MWICNCEYVNKDSAEICQKCGNLRENCEQKFPKISPMEKEPNDTARKLWILVGGGIAIFIILAIVFVGDSNRESTNVSSDYYIPTPTPRIEYERYALSAVSEHLKSPPTLQNYALMDSNENGEYIVQIKVTSQNSFGAELYSTWVVYLRDIDTTTGNCKYSLRECSDEMFVDAVVESLKKSVGWKE